MNKKAVIIRRRLKYDFRSCKKKKMKNILVKNLFEKGPWHHIFYDMAWVSPRGSCWLCNFCHVAL